MADSFDPEPMITRFKERAAAVKRRNLPPVGGEERQQFIRQAEQDFMDFAMIGDAEATHGGWRCSRSASICGVGVLKPVIRSEERARLAGYTGISSHADVAQLVEHHLAKVRVAGSSLVVRSNKTPGQAPSLWWGLSTSGPSVSITCPSLALETSSTLSFMRPASVSAVHRGDSRPTFPSALLVPSGLRSVGQTPASVRRASIRRATSAGGIGWSTGIRSAPFDADRPPSSPSLSVPSTVPLWGR